VNSKASSSVVLLRDAGEVRLAKVRVDELIVKSGALQHAILNSSNFSVIATDEKGVVELFNAGAELMLGYAAADVVDKITGLKVLSILSDDPTTTHIPIIALSANANPQAIEKGLQAGFLKYLTKPIKVDELMETLDLGLAAAAASQPLIPNGA
jgi:CheY-like chemotaxis protein